MGGGGEVEGNLHSVAVSARAFWFSFGSDTFLGLEEQGKMTSGSFQCYNPAY